jgi:putative hydrolase of the HAD superfamily
MIRTVIFDLGGVIVPLDFPSAYRALAACCPVPAAELPQRISSTGLVPLYESGVLTDAQFTQQFCEALGLDLSSAQFRDLWNSLFGPHTLIPDSLLAGLKQQGFRLVLLSNTNGLHFDMIREQYPLLSHFDDFVLSYRVGATKPSPRIYEQAITSARCLPQECFYTDDILPYVEAARTAGIDAVQFHSYEQLLTDLGARGITPA